MKNIHVLPTDKPSRIYTCGSALYMNKVALEHNTNQHIYITNDEEIKEGDYGILGKTILSYHQMHKKWGMPQGKKIILTTDQELIKDGVQAIDDEFLEWFVKNPSCELVDIVKTAPIRPFGSLYKIIIPNEEKTKCYCGHTTTCDCGPEEPKQETTLEEVAERLYPTDCTNWSIKIPLKESKSFIAGAKWQQEQNKKMYSEEEVDFFVKNILHHIKYYEYNVNNLELISFSNDIESEIEKLYEEFKNK